MKLFTEIRKNKVDDGPIALKGEVVYRKKHGKYTVVINKDKDGYRAYIDGDFLDKFRSERDAKKSIDMALKVIG